MEFTGERVVPGLVEADLLNEHVARYVFAEQFVAGKRVLDAGCGSGYGADRLAQRARWVVGVDNSAEAIGYAREHYARANLCFLRGDCERVGLGDHQFDVIVSFEVIEHLARYELFLEECKRVLRPSGVLLLSTPNRVYYSEERQQANPFHHREFNREELASELGRYFAHVKLLAQNHVPSLLLAPPEGGGTTETIIERGPQRYDEPHFWMGVCSATPLAVPLRALCYVPVAANVLRERERHIRLLKQEIADLKKTVGEFEAALGRLEKEFNERGAWASRLDRELKEREQALGQVQKEFDERSAWALQLAKELKEREQALGLLQKEFDERTAWALQLKRECDERTAWALQLDADLKKTQEDLRRAQEQIIAIKKTRAYRLAKFLRLV